MEEGLSTTKISYEAGKRTKKAKRSGSGNIAVCRTAKAHNPKWITRPRLKQALFFFFFFHFPKTTKRRKDWLQSISRFPRRGEKDKFNVSNVNLLYVNFILTQKT